MANDKGTTQSKRPTTVGAPSTTRKNSNRKVDGNSADISRKGSPKGKANTENSSPTKSRPEKRSNSTSKTPPKTSNAKRNSGQQKKDSSGASKDLSTKPNTQMSRKSQPNQAGGTTQGLNALLRSVQFSKFVNYDQARKICAFDAVLVANNDQHFVTANTLQYYLSTNIWCSLIMDVCGEQVAQLISRYIRRWGLLQTIDEACQTANTLIASLANGTQVRDLNPIGHVLIGDGGSQVDDLIQVCRFLKRFTVTNAISLEDATRKKFLDTLHRTNWRAIENEKYQNGTCKDPNPSAPRFMYRMELRRILSDIFPERKFRKFLKEAPVKFSNGVCSDAKNLRDKLRVLSKQWYALDDIPYYPIGLGDAHVDSYNKPDVNVVTVPKNYKTYRTIAPETVYVSIHMQKVLYALEKCIASSKYVQMFNVHDQEPNRRNALIGSVEEESWVTYDLTSASDSIPRYLMHEVLPRWIWDEIEPYLPQAIYVAGKKYAPSIFLTSGNPCTFILEGALFLAICLFAKKRHELWCHGEHNDDPQVFGDDIEIPFSYALEVHELLDQLGFIINDDKSYVQGHYRESCGVEYYFGYPVHSDYWPRKEVSAKDGIERVIATLCDLQHRLFRFKQARWALEEATLCLYPKMTYSLAGSNSFDLWSELPVNSIVCAPFGPLRNPLYSGLKDVDAQTLIKKYTPDVVGRSRHVVLKQQGELRLQPSDADRLEVYLYYQYLSHGPQYPDYLSEILRVSDPPARHIVQSDNVVLTTAQGD